MAKCKFCRKPGATLKPPNKLRYFCSYRCMARDGLSDVKKINKDKDKAKLKVLNQTVSHWRPKAQSEFNTFIRLRDYGLPCISCGSTQENNLRGGSFDCGHYVSTGAAAELRFTEDNAHRQCKRCNRQLSGNAVKYRINLIERIGEFRVSLLETYSHQPRWRWDDYKRVYDWYHAINKQIKKEMGI